jgi:hypothetical protein
VRFSHAAEKTHAIFDDEHVISYGGLVPALRLAERADLDGLVGEHVAITAAEGVNASAKAVSIVAGMACGADSIDDLDVLRYGGMNKLFEAMDGSGLAGQVVLGGRQARGRTPPRRSRRQGSVYRMGHESRPLQSRRGTLSDVRYLSSDFVVGRSAKHQALGTGAINSRACPACGAADLVERDGAAAGQPAE